MTTAAGTAKRIRHTAAGLARSHPELPASGHLTDAAAQLETGNARGALRHLDAARHTLTPVSLMRHGLTDDVSHVGARAPLGAIDRHALAVRDLQDAGSSTDPRTPERLAAR